MNSKEVIRRGDKVKITDNIQEMPHDFNIGQICEVVRILPSQERKNEHLYIILGMDAYSGNKFAEGLYREEFEKHTGE